jgi:hypothetical protein
MGQVRLRTSRAVAYLDEASPQREAAKWPAHEIAAAIILNG